MDLLSVIRRWRFRDKLPIREIGRRTGLSRNTIRKYLRSDVVDPVFKVPDRPCRLDPFAEEAVRLAADRGGQVTQAAAHGEADADLVELGFDGS